MQMQKEDFYRALKSRDARFDGIFFNCVKTTKIYCRPICPTHAPKIENCLFVSGAAEAEKLGYRPCLRCRPELAPLLRISDYSPAHALARRIEDTLLVDETLGNFAKKYRVSERQLRRQFIAIYGVEPKQYLTTRRLLFAKQLLQDTTLPSIDIAYSAGFTSPQRLTVSMRNAYGFTPQQFRKNKTKVKSKYLKLRINYRPPFDWITLLEILKKRATPLESVEKGLYSRMINGQMVVVANDANHNRLTIELPVELSQQSYIIVRKIRHLFDLDADPLTIQNALDTDRFLKRLGDKYPGIRVPGTWSGFELLIRVIIGQQISVAGATTIMHRLVERIGIEVNDIANSSVDDIALVGLPKKRAQTIHIVAHRVQNGLINLNEQNAELFYKQLITIPGIGPWTAEYLKLRVLHWPDAFPAGDLGIQKALQTDGIKASEKAALELSQKWRPWRSYATMLLWKSISNIGG